MRLHKHSFLLAAGLLSMPLFLPAAEWTAQPDISLRTGYNDNVRLTTAAHDSVWESVLTPRIKFGVAAENQGLSGNADYAIRRYAGGDGLESSEALDREDLHLGAHTWRNTLRDSFKLETDYRRDSTLDSELDETGSVSELGTRKKLAITPSWTRALAETTSLKLEYSYSETDNSSDTGFSRSSLVDYEYNQATVQLQHLLTPRIQGFLVGSFSQYRPDTDVDSDTLALQAGLTGSFSESLQWSAMAGQRQTTADTLYTSGFCINADPDASFPDCAGTGGFPVGTDLVSTEVETDSPVYSASITKQLETGSLTVSLVRSAIPDSNGELLDSEHLTLSGEYRISETLLASLQTEHIRNETIVSRIGPVVNQDRDKFTRFIPRIRWQWRREWGLTGEYQYIRSDDPVAGIADRNAYYLTLSYRPVKYSVSR